MKILFINIIDYSRKKADELASPAFGTLYLASYLEKHGFRNIQVLQTDHADAEALERINPDIVGISSITQHFGIATRICKDMKRWLNVPVVMGGIHISMLPQSLPMEADIGVIGEGEQTMLELAQLTESGHLIPSYLQDVYGIEYWDNAGKLKTTPRRPLIQPLDSIPYPARHLIEFKPGQTHSLLTSRGCPYSCAFCSPYAMWRSVRYFSPEYVIGELSSIWTAYHPEWMSFGDDLFAVNKPRLSLIASLMRREDFYGRVRFMCSARANLVDDETVRLLKSMGVTSVCMGLESGSLRVLSYLKCGSVTVQQNKMAIDTLYRNGVDAIASFIIGSPGETREEMMETLEFIKKSKLTSFEPYVLLPLPGTRVWEYARAKGVVSDDMDWSHFEFCMEESPRSRVTVSDLPEKDLLSVLAKFQREKRRRRASYMLKRGVGHPSKIAGFLKRRYASWRRRHE